MRALPRYWKRKIKRNTGRKNKIALSDSLLSKSPVLKKSLPFGSADYTTSTVGLVTCHDI